MAAPLTPCVGGSLPRVPSPPGHLPRGVQVRVHSPFPCQPREGTCTPVLAQPPQAPPSPSTWCLSAMLRPPSIVTSSPNDTLVATGAACPGVVQPVPQGWCWGCRGAGEVAEPPLTLTAGPAGFLLLQAGVANVTSMRSSSRQGGLLHPNFGAKSPRTSHWKRGGGW